MPSCDIKAAVINGLPDITHWIVHISIFFSEPGITVRAIRPALIVHGNKSGRLFL
jgi:hypothetical protein